MELLTKAQTAFDGENYSEAYELFSQVLAIEPDNPTALLYGSVSSAWGSTINDDKIPEATAGFARAIAVQHEKCGDTEEFFVFATTGMTVITLFQITINNLFINYYNKISEVTVYDNTSKGKEEARVRVQDNAIQLVSLSIFMVETLFGLIASYREADDNFFNMEIIVLQNVETYLNNANVNSTNAEAEAIRAKSAALEEKVKETQQQKYWDQHPEEYQSYITNQKRLQELKEQRRILVEKRGGLSTFDFAGKKELKKQIAALESEIESILESNS